MKLRLDTDILQWAVGEPKKLLPEIRRPLGDPENTLLVSAASLWEVTIKRGLGREDFQAYPRLLRRGLFDNDYVELPIVSAHTVMAGTLPPILKDPFDSLLVAQALYEGVKLISVDPQVLRYFEASASSL